MMLWAPHHQPWLPNIHYCAHAPSSAIIIPVFTFLRMTAPPFFIPQFSNLTCPRDPFGSYCSFSIPTELLTCPVYTLPDTEICNDPCGYHPVIPALQTSGSHNALHKRKVCLLGRCFSTTSPMLLKMVTKYSLTETWNLWKGETKLRNHKNWVVFPLV